MDAVETFLTSTDKIDVIIGFFVALIALQSIIKLFDYFRERFGIETRFTRREKEQSEVISILKSEVDKIKNDQTKIMALISGLQESVDNMQKKSDMNKAAELKDRIGQAYRYYHQIGKINIIEKEALKDLITAYSQFSDNSFVHSLVEKEMETWEVIEN